ncbi:hypothetical protein NDU88_005115 [Pleurodeles waltl]|uniref:Uncharacterized protein n=1 Tax=Pleurodeles waltl TaxID=8319 RepID=A0AAV7TA21_PLEWA|nr:hypothetical protein NDU88_005115 [Pleurodeles waltl]
MESKTTLDIDHTSTACGWKLRADVGKIRTTKPDNCSYPPEPTRTTTACCRDIEISGRQLRMQTETCPSQGLVGLGVCGT